MEGSGVCEIHRGDTKIGEVVLGPGDRIRKGKWRAEAAFAQTELCRAAYYMLNGQLYVPSAGKVGKVPITSLMNLAGAGPDRRDIHDGFNHTETKTAYPALWGQDTELVQSIAHKPNSFLSPLHKPKKGRHLRKAEDLWKKAGRVLVAERIRLNTVRVVATLLPRRVLSNTWWPIAILKKHKNHDEIEKILALWLNSTFGLLTLMSERVDTEGPWVAIKKPILSELKVLDPFALTAEKREKLAAAYDSVANGTMQRITEVDQDKIRAQVDDAILSAIGIDADIQPLRELIASEPLLQMKSKPKKREQSKQKVRPSYLLPWA